MALEVKRKRVDVDLILDQEKAEKVAVLGADLERAMTREFCAECGTHVATRPPGLPGVVIKVGTLDDPSLFDGPNMAIYTVDKQPYHHVPEGLPAFERLPQR